MVDNKKVALSQLSRLTERLEKNPNLEKGHADALEEMESLGFIEEVYEERAGPNLVFYLAHFPCIRESSSTTKIRLVFDASSKGLNGVSVNDCLEAGPNLNPGVADILIRFCRCKYAVTADVRKAFLQIEMRSEDQDVQRFLWLKDDNICVMKFTRVTFGVKCSPFLLSGTIHHHLSLCPPSFVIKELQYIYIWMTSCLGLIQRRMLDGCMMRLKE